MGRDSRPILFRSDPVLFPLRGPPVLSPRDVGSTDRPDPLSPPKVLLSSPLSSKMGPGVGTGGPHFFVVHLLAGVPL